MGLAASQARFLAITSRKTNCEFQSMQIAQNKLSISRELAQATTDYQNSLNATKLVWDFDCDNTGYLATPCQNAVNLSYNTLMIPSIYNNYQPYLTTTKTGAIVLNPKYAAAARAAGIAAGSGEHQRSKDGFYKFLDALVDNGLLPESTNNAIQEGKFYVYQGKRAEDGGNTYVYDKELNPNNADDNKLITDNKLNTLLKSEENPNGYIKGYDPNAGFGSTPLSKNSVIASNIIGLSTKLTEALFEENTYSETIKKDKNGYTLEKDTDGNITFKDTDGNIIGTIANGQTNVLDKDGNEITNDETKNLLNVNNYNTKTISESNTEGDAYKISQNSSLLDENEIKDITIGDLLLNDVSVIYTFPDNNNNDNDGKIFGKNNPSLEDVKTALSSADLEHFREKLTSDIDDIFKKLQRSTKYDPTILARAKDAVVSLYSIGGLQGEAAKNRDTADALTKAINGANRYNSLFVATTEGGSYNCSVGYSLSNILACMLTFADRYTKGGDSNYYVSTRVEESNFVTMDENYSYPIHSENSTDQLVLLQTDYYMQLYNNICLNGWTENEAVDNDYYFEQLLKNGTYFMSSLSDDGYFYQEKYNGIDRLLEVKDEDAIAQAELEFQRIKANLTYKEDKLDLDMKNLDAEISSLTTELDSVKNLISKNVEKTFTMFQ